MGIESRKVWLFAAAASAALATGATVNVASAQEAATPANDDIIVTATRREARLQDVPIAVTPITAQMIQNSGIRDVQDLTSVAPSLQFNVSENESSATARLRGVGTQGSNPGLESAVGIFIDGVYRARNGVALGDLGEISQVEVLRGPQGTLFGRNTSAGLINIRTAGPNMTDFGADAEFTYGDYNETRAEASITGPLFGETLGARLFGAIAKRDGFIDVNPGGANPSLTANNRGKGEDNTRDVWTVRGQLQFEPNSNISNRFIADYSKRDETCCAARIYDPVLLNGFLMQNQGTAAGLGTQVPFGTGRQQWVANLGGYGPNGIAALRGGDLGTREAFANRPYDQDIEDWGVSNELTWDLAGNLTFTSVTALRNWLYENAQDSDFSQADLTYLPGNGANYTEFEVFTQEFRLAGQAGPVDWLVGAFYADEQIDRRFEFRTGSQYGQYFAGLDALVTGGSVAPGLGIAPIPAPTATGPLLAGAYNALAALPNNSGITGDLYTQEGKSLAVFTHNIWSIDDKTDLTIGLRYTNEEKDLSADYNTAFDVGGLLTATATSLDAAAAGAGAIAAGDILNFANCTTTQSPNATARAVIAVLRSGYCVPWVRSGLDAGVRQQSREENEWSGVISARRDFTDTTSGYISFSKGYKAGGFNFDRNFSAVYSTAFDAEKVDAYEVGLKNAFLGGDLLVNMAAYYNEYSNFQLNTFNGIQFVVTSVPEVTAQGVELDTIWQTPINGLSYQGGVAYTEAEYGADTGWVASNANPITGDLTLRWLPESRLTNSPLWTTTHSLTYRKGLFNDAAEGLAYVDFRYVSDQVTGSDLRASKAQPGYFLVNARLGLTMANERVGLELWGRNILDEEYQQIAFDVPLQQGGAGPSQGAFLGDPRTYGVTLRVKY